jgi:hypothetical protein
MRYTFNKLLIPITLLTLLLNPKVSQAEYKSNFTVFYGEINNKRVYETGGSFDIIKEREGYTNGKRVYLRRIRDNTFRFGVAQIKGITPNIDNEEIVSQPLEVIISPFGLDVTNGELFLGPDLGLEIGTESISFGLLWGYTPNRAVKGERLRVYGSIELSRLFK